MSALSLQHYQHHQLISHRSSTMVSYLEMIPRASLKWEMLGISQIWNLYPLPPSLPSPILSSNWMMISLMIYLSQSNNHMIIQMILLLLLITNVELNSNS